MSFNSLAEDNNTHESSHSETIIIENGYFIETITETSNEAYIYGVQAGGLSQDAFNSVNVYFGLGVMSIDLKQKNYSFNALRGFLGLSTNWKIAPYAEVGIDMLEEIFDVCNGGDDDYCSTDPSFSLGLRWKVTPELMLNFYRKWYQFDGPILDRTNVGVSGISLGVRF